MNTILYSLYLFRKRHKLQFFFHDQLFQHISVRSRPGFDWTVERRASLCVILKNTKHISFNRPFSSCPKPLLQSEAKCEVVEMKMISIIMEIELIFRKKVFTQPGFENQSWWEMANALQHHNYSHSQLWSGTTTSCKSTWDTVPYFGLNGLPMILCLWFPVHPAVQRPYSNLEKQLWIEGRREVSIISQRPVAGSDFKQERSFFRRSVSTFLQLVEACSRG